MAKVPRPAGILLNTLADGPPTGIQPGDIVATSHKAYIERADDKSPIRLHLSFEIENAIIMEKDDDVDMEKKVHFSFTDVKERTLGIKHIMSTKLEYEDEKEGLVKFSITYLLGGGKIGGAG